MISVSRSTSLMIDAISLRGSSPRSTSSSPSSSALRPIDDSGLRTSCAICAAIRPTVASRSDRIRRCSRSWMAAGHRVELARQIADLVVRRDARPLPVVAAAELPGVGPQHPPAAAASAA